ncbi:type II secretion system F family protein [Paracoccus sp. S-4012]|uniref:type II secretion system F family protein n=1 Tax=Paracoccus sp. S-4012 TaxID=2665648 RepID=UPI0012B098F3|nr:type II secretion system F family protein [Paracoccus sp. S-4012]MRX51753.1 type II secretion system F family protein [Paracoccus sp. S-4012]
MYEALQEYRGVFLMLATGLAVFLAAIGLAWPYLFLDVRGSRIRQLSNAWQASRLGGARLPPNRPKHSLLANEPREIYAAIVRRLNLSHQLEDGAAQRLLQMAGFRGRAPVITFLAMRVLMPLVMLGLSAFYIFVVIKPNINALLMCSISLACAASGYYLPVLYLKNRITKRQKSIFRAWPNALDLLMICVESGMSIEHAFRKVGDEISSQSKELAEELALTTAELSFLPDRRIAYENLGRRTDLESVKSVVSGLMQSEQYGTSLGSVLRVLAQENRSTRMSLAEKKAAALAPKLTVPMILFFLPILFAVIITPAVIQILNE